MKARSISLILFLSVRIFRQNLNSTSASSFSLFSYLLLLFFLFVLFTRWWGGIAGSGSRRRRRIGETFDHQAVIKWRQLASWNSKHKYKIEPSFLSLVASVCVFLPRVVRHGRSSGGNTRDGTDGSTDAKGDDEGGKSIDAQINRSDSLRSNDNSPPS